MRNIAINVLLILSMFFSLTSPAKADRDRNIYELAKKLTELSTYMAQTSYDHYKGWGSEISDQEQSILFEAESFAASCRLFLRLTEERFNYFKTGYLRTNLYNAFVNLTRAFNDLKKESQRAQRVPYSLDDCERMLDRMEYEFSLWPSADNLAYLHQKYIKTSDNTVYLIERRGPGEYVRRPFKSLESLFRFNYDQNRGKDPWQHLVEVSYETLERMEEVEMVDLTFEGDLVIEIGDRPNRPVYLIKDGKKCGITSPSVLQRYGGWDNVYEVPAEVIKAYPDGEAIKD
ncbi:MAG: hypothetical protein JSV17_12480 [Candidatus Aminicenantes bacterium]|nr:MAG: hypothetical protein JSV17_12480 [Candidatus Aminicenantes bacterium]